MKNRFLFVFMLLLFGFGTAMAQTSEPERHWDLSGQAPEWDFMSASLVIDVNVDGVRAANSNYEMAAFIGNTLVSRGSFPNATNGYYYVTAFAFANPSAPQANGNRLTFKLYDHESEQELDYVCYTEIVSKAFLVLGSAGDPFVINFFTGETNWELVTDASSLVPGDVILITDTDVTNNGSGFALTQDFFQQNDGNAGNGRKGTIVTYANGTMSWPTEPYEAEDDFGDITMVTPLLPQPITIQNSGDNKLLFAGKMYFYSSGNNNLMSYFTQDEAPTSDWTVEYDTDHMNINVAGTERGIKYRPAQNAFIATDAAYSNAVKPIDIYRIITAPDVVNYTVELLAEPQEGGTVSGGGEVPAGTEITITATPNENDGYTFTGWSYQGEEEVFSTDAEYTFSVTESVTIVANFALIPTFNVTVTVSDEAAGTASITQEAPYYYGDVITLTYTLENGYEFDSWTVTEGEGEVVETDGVYTYTVTGPATITANFTHVPYTVTVVADEDAGTASITEGAPYYYGDVITLTYTEQLGYEFDSWTVEGEGEVAEADGVYTYTVTGNATITANFTHIPYTVTVTVNPAESGTYTIDPQGTYYYGDQITVTANPTEGYQFVNFTVDGTEVNMPYTVTANVEIVANFLTEDVTTFAITTIANPTEGGTVTGTGTYADGTTVTLTATANEGYTFINWTKEGDAEVNIEDASFELVVSEDATYIANFQINTYEVTVTANPAEGGTVSGADTYEYNAEVTVSATANEEYNFVNWTTVNGNPVSEEAEYTFNVTEDIELIANFELKPVQHTVTVTANPAEGGTVTGADTYDEGTSVTVTATANQGYTFINWTVNDNEVSDEASYTFTIEDDMNLVANFEPIAQYEVTITAVPAEGGTVSGADIYDEGTSVTVTALANEGYEFDHWTMNGEEVSEEASYTFTIEDNAVFVAYFNEVIIPVNQYTVQLFANPVAGGTVEGADTYEEGETVTIIATPNEGYEFTEWTLNGYTFSEDATYQFVIEEDLTLVANFTLIPVTVYHQVNFVIDPEEAGEVDMENGEYAENEELTVTATANEGYEFNHWEVNGEEPENATNTSLTFTVTEDLTITAVFELIPVVVEYNITIDEAIENGTVTAPATSPAGEEVTVTVTPNPMYALVSLYYYTTDPEETTEINITTKTFVMPEADVTIGAEFILVSGKGDVNLDGEVNILDILATLNFILEKNPQPFDFDQADMNEDGIIDISDVMAINALILGLKSECEDATAVYEIIDGKLYIDSEIALAGYQFRLNAEPTVIDMPGFSTVGNWSNGEYIFIVYNLSGEKASGLYAILDLGNAMVSNVTMATKEGCKVRGIEGTVSVNSFDESVYSVFPVPANDKVKVAGPGINQIEVFNTMGQRVMVINNVNADETVVNVMNLTAGSYLFRINTNNGVTTKNVIVVR